MAFKMKGPRIFGKKNKVVSYDDKNEGTGTDYKKGVKKTVTRTTRKGEVKTREKMITAKKAERQMARK
jgi:hypothetical protein